MDQFKTLPIYDDVATPMNAIVDQIMNGHFDLDNALKLAKEGLDSKFLEHHAEELVAKGEQFVSVLESYRQNDAVQSVLNKLGSMEIDSSILNFNAESILSEAEATLSDVEGRNMLMNKTKDQVLGFLLEHLPSMSIPDIQGKFRCYLLSYLSMS